MELCLDTLVDFSIIIAHVSEYPLTLGKLDTELLSVTCQLKAGGRCRCAERTSKKPNSYGVSGGPTIRARTLRMSLSRQATAIAWSKVS